MVTTNRLIFQLKADGERLRLQGCDVDGHPWQHPDVAAGLFSIVVDGKALDASGLPLREVVEDTSQEGVHGVTARFGTAQLEVDYHLLAYAGTALLEVWPVVRCVGERAGRLTRLDSVSFPLAGGAYELSSFSGDWGKEFEPQTTRLAGKAALQSRSGRSSKGEHPWFALTDAAGRVFSASVAWSGNWIFRFDPLAENGSLLSGGINDWEFSHDLAPGDEIEGAHVVLVWGNSLNDVSQQYSAVGRKHWYPRNALSARAPVEWNHWWSYEDMDINEEVFASNVETAAKLGMEVCTLDAGWFGPSDAGAHWYEHRGDWDLVNTRRFPHGIRALADLTHARGMAFGLWCEIEGLGIDAQLARDHPDFVATRGGARLGYVCFGNPAVQEWAFNTLSRLIREHGCDWIKLDFNLDPGAGCDRPDHGHQPGDGLYAHILGYYRTLERLRAAFPEVVLENCSSGGLRIDLGILRHTDMTFLSDPDWPVHDLQIFWGASCMLAPDALLHWGYCDWSTTNPPPQQKFNPHDPHLTQQQFDYYTRMSMLGLYGYSQKLPGLPGWMAQRVADHNRIYKEQVRRFVREADLYRLTAQPRRSGEGERWCAFQYSLPGGAEHLLFVFRLPGAEAKRSIRLQNLDAEQNYRVEGLEGEFSAQLSGRELMDAGLPFDNLAEENSAVLKITSSLASQIRPGETKTAKNRSQSGA